MHAAPVRAVQDQLGEGVVLGLGPEPGEGTVVAGGEDPPRRLALGAVLADEDRHLGPLVAAEAEPNDASFAAPGASWGAARRRAGPLGRGG